MHAQYDVASGIRAQTGQPRWVRPGVSNADEAEAHHYQIAIRRRYRTNIDIFDDQPYSRKARQIDEWADLKRRAHEFAERGLQQCGETRQSLRRTRLQPRGRSNL